MCVVVVLIIQFNSVVVCICLISFAVQIIPSIHHTHTHTRVMQSSYGGKNCANERSGMPQQALER